MEVIEHSISDCRAFFSFQDVFFERLHRLIWIVSGVFSNPFRGWFLLFLTVRLWCTWYFVLQLPLVVGQGFLIAPAIQFFCSDGSLFSMGLVGLLYTTVCASPWFVTAPVDVGYALRVFLVVTTLPVYRWPQVESLEIEFAKLEMTRRA